MGTHNTSGYYGYLLNDSDDCSDDKWSDDSSVIEGEYEVVAKNKRITRNKNQNAERGEG